MNKLDTPVGDATARTVPTPSAKAARTDRLDRTSVIYRAIQTAIAEQRLLPKTRLSEDQLGGIFGASRTLVRSALQSLARDGMVVLARNKGATVASPSVLEARELFEARRMVETVTISRATARISEQDLARLDALLTAGQEALAEQDRGRAIRMSGEFHLAVSRIADQSVLHAFLSGLIARSSLVIALYGHAGRSDCGDAEHRGLIDALRRGDARRASTLMLEHLDHIEADLDLTRQDRASGALAEVFRPSDIERSEPLIAGQP